MDGCLEYGNQSLDIKATFFGDSKEQQKVDHENEIGCRQTAAEAPSSGQGSLGVVEKLIRIVQSVTNYLPSSSKYPGQTMLHLQGEAGIAVKDNETYLVDREERGVWGAGRFGECQALFWAGMGASRAPARIAMMKTRQRAASQARSRRKLYPAAARTALAASPWAPAR